MGHPSNSVLATQKPLLALQHEIFLAERTLVEMKARLQQLVERHCEQIKRSLTSPDPKERQMAASVAAYWEVLPPPGEPRE